MSTPPKLPRLLAGWHAERPMSLTEHRAVHGVPQGHDAKWLAEMTGMSGLRGRGGSGFPTARKLQAVNAMPRRRGRVVLVNGAEGEPDSRKDSALLFHAPHLVLDGVAAACEAVGAKEAILCVGTDAPEASRALQGAIRERGGSDRVVPQLVEVPQAYVAGEESALVNFLNTGSPLPTFTPPLPAERGVDGRPTLVQNVETLAHLALIAANGPEWFRELGTEEDPGSALVTVSGAVAKPGLYEIEAGTPLRSLLDTAGGPTDAVQALLVGGYAGTWFEPAEAGELVLGHAALRAAGGTLGPGAIEVLGVTRCGLKRTAVIARYMADHSAGQCGPCTFGLPAIADALEAIADGVAQPGDFRWVQHWAGLVSGRGACHHPDGAARMVASALEVFADDITRHEVGDVCIASGLRREPAEVL